MSQSQKKKCYVILPMWDWNYAGDSWSKGWVQDMMREPRGDRETCTSWSKVQFLLYRLVSPEHLHHLWHNSLSNATLFHWSPLLWRKFHLGEAMSHAVGGPLSRQESRSGRKNVWQNSSVPLEEDGKLFQYSCWGCWVWISIKAFHFSENEHPRKEDITVNCYRGREEGICTFGKCIEKEWWLGKAEVMTSVDGCIW